MKSRLRLPAVDRLDPDQAAIHRSIVETRGNVDGPFLAWLLVPGLAEPAQRLGAFCRYGTALSLAESELLILLVAAAHDCLGEQQIHEPVARKAGLPEAVITEIRSKRPPVLSAPRETTLYRLATSLLQTHRIPEPTYRDAEALFGQEVLVQIVGIIGYYTLVAMTLNAFEMTKA